MNGRKRQKRNLCFKSWPTDGAESTKEVLAQTRFDIQLESNVDTRKVAILSISGRHLLGYGGKEGILRVWDTKTSKMTKSVPFPREILKVFLVDAQGTLVILCGTQGSDATGAALELERNIFQISGNLLSAMYSPALDAILCLLQHEDGVISVMNCKTGGALKTIGHVFGAVTEAINLEGVFSKISVSHFRKSTNFNAIEVVDLLEETKSTTLFTGDFSNRARVLNSSKTKLVSGHFNGEVYVWCLVEFVLLWRLQASLTAISGVALMDSPYPILISCGWDGVLRVWDYDTRAQLRSSYLKMGEIILHAESSLPPLITCALNREMIVCDLGDIILQVQMSRRRNFLSVLDTVQNSRSDRFRCGVGARKVLVDVVDLCGEIASYL